MQSRDDYSVDQVVVREGAVLKKNTALLAPKGVDIVLFDILGEEQMSQDAIQQFMNSRKKVFRLLFNKYANSGYSSKRGNSFDALGQKSSSISLAEVNKMMKENTIMPRLINKDEISTLVRLVNHELL